MKQVSVKQAQRWLEKLKNENQQSFKELSKILKKYERTDDQYECYIKMSHLFLQTPNLTREINVHLEEGNKFIVQELEEEKITRMMDHIKHTRAQKFQQILELIREMSMASNNMSADQQNKNLLNCLKEIVKGDKELEQLTNQTFKTGEQLINAQDLQHLKVNHQQHALIQDPEEEGSHMKPIKKVKKDPVPSKPRQNPITQNQKKQIVSKPKALTLLPNMTINQEKKMLRHLQRSLGGAIYDQIVKLMHIYHLCIITRSEAVQLIDFIQSEEQFDILRDIIESRQNDRRKSGGFRPLNDNDFSLADRASPSYVTVPNSYPIRCANRTQSLKKLLNDKWISVPYGSQQAFNVRNKNSFETALLKCEDERYQFDLYTNRLNKAEAILQKIIKLLQQDGDKNFIKELINKVIEMGVVQIVYRNSNREQKEELEWHLKANQMETCLLFRQRIQLQANQLRIIKEVHALKNWTEVAVKNFAKSLDLKSFQFKKGEKDKMKGQSFINELNDKIKILENGGEQKLFSIPFEDKKSFFTVFNSFESSSKTERCLHRKIPQIKTYDIKQFSDKSCLPVMIFAFEDTKACNQIYSLLLFYIDSSISNESQRNRSKAFLEQVLVRFLKWDYGEKKCLSTEFDEQRFYQKLNGMIRPQDQQMIDLNRWIYSDKQSKMYSQFKKDNNNIADLSGKFITLESDKKNSLSFLPPKEQNSQILYVTENFYVFLRFLYALYERIIRVRQVAENSEKQILFYMLFFNCIKSKEGVKFQQNLNNLFGRQAYLFSTIYKLFESLAKSINTAAICQSTQQSIKYSKCIKSQEIYFLLMNRYNLQNNITNSRMIRLNYYQQTKILYLNSHYSYYRCDEQLRDHVRKRQEISRSIQVYTYDNIQTMIDKKKKKLDSYEENGLEYIFQSNSYKMVNYREKQDYFVSIGRKIAQSKALKREIKRITKFNSRIN